MFREMRRKRQQIPLEETEAIFREGTHGILSIVGDDGYPYGVPLSYAYRDGKFYFHGSNTGHKADAIGKGCKASFTVVHQDIVVPEQYTTRFISAIAFGQVKVLEDREEKIEATKIVAKRYWPEDTEEHLSERVENALEAMSVMVLEPEHMTGKESKYLMEERNKNNA